MIHRRILATSLVVMALVGCTKDPAPDEQMRLTEQAVAQAKAIGADEQIPEMVQAERKLALAQKNMTEQDFNRARRLAEQAELDARLAEGLVLTAKSETQLADLNARIKRLQKQLGALQ